MALKHYIPQSKAQLVLSWALLWNTDIQISTTILSSRLASLANFAAPLHNQNSAASIYYDGQWQIVWEQSQCPPAGVCAVPSQYHAQSFPVAYRPKRRHTGSEGNPSSIPVTQREQLHRMHPDCRYKSESHCGAQSNQSRPPVM